MSQRLLTPEEIDELLGFNEDGKPARLSDIFPPAPELSEIDQLKNELDSYRNAVIWEVKDEDGYEVFVQGESGELASEINYPVTAAQINYLLRANKLLSDELSMIQQALVSEGREDISKLIDQIEALNFKVLHHKTEREKMVNRANNVLLASSREKLEIVNSKVTNILKDYDQGLEDAAKMHDHKAAHYRRKNNATFVMLHEQFAAEIRKKKKVYYEKKRALKESS